jgi:predicted Mrr-cat superfamily restriction endonuclease
MVGEIVGNYEWPQAPYGLHHTRPVRWLGDMPRSDLVRPVHMQDPRVVFGLRDEPGVAAVTSVERST